ncbi:hypothetical protein [Actinoalloteichus hymeniacidonis]|uniref:Uncharacterized protein n=1 Tax=Actinoalloteichus hymeniacidonis TaxID=340345 RepID=A0AAC9HP18_9PSEU|nr:hypothetical protein [Actinoalloteichus hymeniacidonis]AOS62808.1 hypothetical protein TL08_09965 [Actinoalloteichus hymeniacidonis]MBB5909161.1 hypothetical protein [Actinoalloteichus hymeniacidonis]
MTETDRPGSPGRHAAAMPNFDGAAELLRLLKRLVTRPSTGEAPVKQQGRRGIPMLCLARDTAQSELLRALREELKTARPRRVPHAYHSFGDIDGQSVHQTALLLAALRSFALQLSTGANTRHGRIRFKRFQLVDWLLHQDFTETEDDLRTRLALRSRRRDWIERGEEPTSEVFGSRWGLLLRAVGALRIAVRLRGRIPGVGVEYRWLLRQPYLAPQDPGTFIGFAERLTRTLNGNEDEGQLQRLIVNAFLEDIRSAHRAFPHFLRAARRTSYTVLLLDDITPHNGGNRLLRLVNDVRNDTGAFDPLVIISGSVEIPPDSAELRALDFAGDQRIVRTADKAEEVYEHWLQKFAGHSRTRHHTAWYLPLRIPAASTDPQRDSMPPLSGKRLTLPSPPWWARRRYTRTIAVLLAAGLVSAGVLLTRDTVETWRVCGVLPGTRDASTLEVHGGECVGVSTGSHIFLQNDSPVIAQIEETIKDTNREMEQKRGGGRDFATVVYLVALDTTRSGEERDDLDSTHEGLMGIAARQHELINDESSPLIRVLVANAGEGMEYGVQVARMIGKLAAEDESLVGVAGLNDSRQATVDTIKELNGFELPMVAATLSAAEMPAASPLYRQVSPDNRREAEVAFEFATQQEIGGGSNLRIISSADDRNFYTVDLARQVATRFKDHFAIEGWIFGDDDDDGAPDPAYRYANAAHARDLGESSCGERLVFFAGGHDAFPNFLRGIKANCGDAMPVILGGDDISRHAANSQLRREIAVPFYYLTFAVGQESCDAEDSNEPSRSMGRLFSEICGSEDYDPALDGHAALAYDALDAFVIAVREIDTASGVPISPGMAHHQLGQIRGNAFNGTTGTIDFNGGQVPIDKQVAVMHTSGNDVVQAFPNP